MMLFFIIAKNVNVSKTVLLLNNINLDFKNDRRCNTYREILIVILIIQSKKML